ncbi:type I restriction enzyme HsdR N-terminal domain-containing protein [Thermodesulfobacteriota bacterium]
MTGHHLILGEQADYLTGEAIADTHDERYRQAIAKLLVEKKGYDKPDILPRRNLIVAAGDKCAQIQIDFIVVLNDTATMIIRYGPGSLVTRHRPAIAASRVVAAYQIPLVVVTNGLDADIIDGKTGTVLSKGLDTIPDRQALLARCHGGAGEPISPERAESEQRILYAYDVDDSCPCDDNICLITK